MSWSTFGKFFIVYLFIGAGVACTMVSYGHPIVFAVGAALLWPGIVLVVVAMLCSFFGFM